jgi:hypothetical protein
MQCVWKKFRTFSVKPGGKYINVKVWRPKEQRNVQLRRSEMELGGGGGPFLRPGEVLL